MSLRQVLTIFNAERQLNDEETALLNTLRKMSGAELESLAVALAPQAKPKPRNVVRCGKCGYAAASIAHKDPRLGDYHLFERPARGRKSTRASSLQQQIAGAGNKPKTSYCTFLMEVNGGQEMCEAKSDDPIHDSNGGYAGYHEFQSARKAAAAGD